MGLKICSFSSGSKGNCTFICNENTQILVDAGISVKKVLEGLVTLKKPPKIDGVLITHSHSDHIRYVREIKEAFDTEVFAYASTAAEIADAPWIQPFDLRDFYVRDITVSPFKLSHDVFCVGYNLFSNGSKVSIATDTGIITAVTLERLQGSESVVIEANHDKELLLKNPRYSQALKHRILSDKGHLSNDASADVVAHLVRTGTKNIILAHLSEENNYPELALDTVLRRLAKENLSAKLSVALQHKMGELA